MNLTGKLLIKVLCERLKFQGKLLFDSNILSLLRSLTYQELNELITFGSIGKWEEEHKNI